MDAQTRCMGDTGLQSHIPTTGSADRHLPGRAFLGDMTEL